MPQRANNEMNPSPPDIIMMQALLRRAERNPAPQGKTRTCTNATVHWQPSTSPVTELAEKKADLRSLSAPGHRASAWLSPEPDLGN